MLEKKGSGTHLERRKQTVFSDCSTDISNHKPVLSNAWILLTFQTFTIIKANAINYLHELHGCQVLVADCTSVSYPVSAEINGVNIKVEAQTCYQYH